MDIHPSRAAGPVTIYRPDENGELKVVEIIPAGTLETAKVSSGRKKGKKADPNRFAESENECWVSYLAPGKRY